MTMADIRPPAVSPGLTPDGETEPDARFADLSTRALRAELSRRRKAGQGSRDTRANPTSSTGVYVENPEFLGMLGRMMHAAGRRVGAMDIDTLGQLYTLLTEETEATLGETCWALRRRGFSWSRIGAQLGMTKQSAWTRFAKYRPADMPVGAPPSGQ
jgi:hypothetical protein